MKFISHQVIYSTQLTSGQKALLEKLLSPKNGYEVSLEFQGGIMNEEEVASFEKFEFYKEAVALRRWADLAKDPTLVSPSIESFTNAIESSLK